MLKEDGSNLPKVRYNINVIRPLRFKAELDKIVETTDNINKHLATMAKVGTLKRLTEPNDNVYMFIDNKHIVKNNKGYNELYNDLNQIVLSISDKSNEKDFDIFRGETLEERKQRYNAIKNTFSKNSFLQMYDFNIKKLYKNHKDKNHIKSLNGFLKEGEVTKAENMILDATLTQTLSGFCEISNADTALT